MKRAAASCLVLSVAILSGYLILTLWKGVYFYLGNPSKENLLQAIQATPSNPNPYYRLALYYQLSIESSDLKQSFHYLGKAIERDPFDQRFWLTLAKALNRVGEKRSSEAAIERALFVFPTGYTGRWMAANLFLQQGEIDKALLNFAYILANYPDRSNVVYEVLARAGRDPDFLLARVVPENLPSLNQYLGYLYELGDREAAIKAWAKKVSLGFKSDRSETLRQIDFLISGGAFHEASRVWRARLKEEGLAVPSDGNLITNGDFEKERMLGGGFDWKSVPVAGVSVSLDPSVVFQGKRALKIRFDGKENVDFHHYYQVVSWRPNHDYVLKAEMKTEGLTTKSGVKIEVIGLGGAGPGLYSASEPLTGDNGWKEVSVDFHTPDKSQGGIVRLRREKTDKFDRFISGSVWLDDVQLKEK